jgi:hypothetical protein
MPVVTLSKGTEDTGVDESTTVLFTIELICEFALAGSGKIRYCGLFDGRIHCRIVSNVVPRKAGIGPIAVDPKPVNATGGTPEGVGAGEDTCCMSFKFDGGVVACLSVAIKEYS